MRALGVALVWHMHQPYYRDDVTGRFLLPWVRRRASKDYLPMIDLVRRHPGLRVTMNMVPSLLRQLGLYATDEVVDAERDLCLRPADRLTPAERTFLIASSEHDDYGPRVSMLAPYVELRTRLHTAGAEAASVDDLRDLQVWSILAWIDPQYITDSPALFELARRGRGFTESDKVTVDAAQLALVRRVVPAYRAAVEAGQVEPLTSPLHHPILPLLIDSRAARTAIPEVQLPEPPFAWPADAEEQIARGRQLFREAVGQDAHGMWPPECAVSPDAAALMQQAGVRFAVSDEGVLRRSLGTGTATDVRASGDLYRPHREASGLLLVFRDADLSNRIGFVYAQQDSRAAATDLLDRLEAIATASTDQPRLVTIALDGENFRDFYAENAHPFISELYTGLTSRRALRSTHVGAFVEENPQAVGNLAALWSGSWIDANFATWIGDAAHTRAWQLLVDARAAIDRVGGVAARPRAAQELLIAEGSDWFWWLSEHHDSGTDAAWDALFRTHLRNAYTLAGLAVPPGVDEAILTGTPLGHDCTPLRAIDPHKCSADWGSAGVAEVGAVFGAMQPPGSSVDRILYGAGGGRLHLRFGDGLPTFDRVEIDAGVRGRVVLTHASRQASVRLPSGGPWAFQLTLHEQGRGVERVPSSGALQVVDTDSARSLRVVLVAAECAPLAVAGDVAHRVADVAADAVALGHQVVVIIPLHRGGDPGVAPGIRLDHLAASAGWGARAARVLQGSHPQCGAPVLSVDLPTAFDRDAIYGCDDDGTRYLHFDAAVVALLDATGFAPDLVHGFEWQSAAVLARLRASESPPATVLSAAPDAPSYRVPREALAALSPMEGAADVDLLELARHSASVVDEVSGGGTVADLYSRALQHLSSSGR